MNAKALNAKSFGAAVVATAMVFAVTPLHAACYPVDQQLQAQQVSDFLANPGALLSQNAQGGAGLISTIRDLAASNPSTLPAIVALLSSANETQQGAIGTGLGQAAQLCLRPDPVFAADIQAQLAATTSEPAKVAYAAITGNRPIAGVALGGPGGGPGGGAGQTNPLAAGNGASSFQSFSASSSRNSPQNYFTSSLSTAGGGSATPGSPSTP
jgi:hypothetical protein